MTEMSPKRELILSASCHTPFTADQAHVNEDSLRRQLGRFVDAGLTAVWLVSSGTAERNVLSDAEVDRIIDIAVAEVSGRIKVYAMGAEPRSAAQNIEFGKRMLDRGVDGVQIGPIEPGHSYFPTPSELGHFYDSAITGIDGPCFLSTHVSVGYEVPPVILARAASEHAQVAGINATHFRSFLYAPQLLAEVGDTVPVVVGSPINALEALLLGASGIMSSFDVNVAPWLYKDFATAWSKQDFTEIRRTYIRMSGLFRRMLGAGGLVVAKAVLDRLGLDGGPPRPPRDKPDDRLYTIAEEIIDQFGLHP